MTALAVDSETLTCYRCGVAFAVPAHWVRQRREDKASFHCPNGHSQAFVQGEVDRLKAELERERAARQREIEATKHQRQRADREERRRIALKGQLTKVKKRVQNGVCPCCKRHFTNLERHMHTKHPGFEGEDIS